MRRLSKDNFTFTVTSADYADLGMGWKLLFWTMDILGLIARALWWIVFSLFKLVVNLFLIAGSIIAALLWIIALIGKDPDASRRGR